MGTTLEDIAFEEDAQEEYEEELRARAIKDYKSGLEVPDNCREIFDYLPINKTQSLEEEYITHLWSSFVSVYDGIDEAQPFAIMPFHLLFMLALQYKILRINKQRKEKYKTAFTMEHPRDDDKEIFDPQSVYIIACLHESKMIDLFKLLNINEELIKEIKALIKNRNENLAHAKGGIAPDLDKKIEQYLGCLRKLQLYFVSMNDEVADEWLKEMGNGQEGADYIELHLAEEYLCPADMQEGKLAKLDKKLNS